MALFTGSSWCQIIVSSAASASSPRGVTWCGRAPVNSSTARMNGLSSHSGSSKQHENVFWISPRPSACSSPFIAHTMALESMPPERHEPTGTSERRCRLTVSEKISRYFSTASSKVPANGAAGRSSYQRRIGSAARGCHVFASSVTHCPPRNWRTPAHIVSSV